ncbi:hypothetical protein UFOVP74_36 [uncultured Caudovirales phage]|uniref:Uncharacterized protein n=1 Tax=uncultured Caudovirales phage TaxID=2100421 RepID=A0A6J5KYT6_9CAUD|nr:hypothetical protein UFOVP74_36 [uncultured Caudovirales phage]
MIEDQLSDLVSPSVSQDLAKLRSDVKETLDVIIDASKKTKGAFDGISMSKDIAEMVGYMKQSADAAKDSTDAMNKLAASYKAQMEAARLAVQQEKAFVEVAKQDTEATKQKTEASKQATEASKAAAAARTAESKAALDNAKAQTEAAKQTEIQQRVTAALTKEKEKLQALLDKEAAQLAKQQSAYYQLNEQYKAAAKNAQNLGAEQALLQNKISSYNAGGIFSGTSSGDVSAAKARLEELSRILPSAQKGAMDLHQQLLNIDQAIGRSQRNVGNYNGAVMAMSQILREAPSFAYSTATGLLAISNNIPILVDEVNRLRAANDILRASGQKTVSIWSALGESLFSVPGLITLAVSAITIFAARMGQQAQKTNEAAKALEDYNKQIKDSEKNAVSNAQSEIVRVKTLTDIAANLNLSMKERIKAVDELQSRYPDYFKNLSKEKILHGDISDAVRKTTDEILANARVKAFEERINATQKRIFDLQESLAELNKQNPANGNVGADMIISGGTQPGIKQQEELAKQFEVRRKVITDEITDLTNKLNGYAAAVTRNAVDAGSAFLSAADKAEKSGNTIIKGLDEQREAAKRYISATIAQQKQEFELDAAKNKAIWEDDNRTLSDRLDALKLFEQDQIILAKLSAQEQIGVISEKLDTVNKKIAEYNAGNIRLNKYQLDALLTDRKTYGIELQRLTKELGVKEAEIIANNINTEEKIIKAGQRAFLTAEEKGLEDRLLDFDKAYNEEAKLLANQYLGKLISEEKFQKEMQKLKNKYQLISLNEQKAEYEYLLKYPQKLSEDQVKDITKKLDKVNSDITANTLDAAKLNGKRPNNPFGLDDDKYNQDVKVAEGVMGLYQQITKAMDARYEAEIAQIERRKQAMDAAATAEIDAINASGYSAAEKEKKIQSVKAQTALKDKEFIREENELKRKQAIADKAANIAQIIQKTALAVISAWALDGPAAPILAGLAAATGAAELATALATPIPQYEHGTRGNAHPGGLARVGEKSKPEAIFEPGKSPYVVDSDRIINLSRGAHVVPLTGSDVAAELAAMGMGHYPIAYTVGTDSNDSMAQWLNGSMQGMRGDIQELSDAILNKPVGGFVMKGGELWSYTAKRNGVTVHLGKRFS